jgi:GNAT superfamily N-acetyltransferase
MEATEKTIIYPRDAYLDEYDMTYDSARKYQDQVTATLKEIFGNEMVKPEWDSVTYDGHTSNHTLVYAPRVDIAVGPFNSYADLDIGNDRTASMKKHFLVKKLQERTGNTIVWNDCARCFLAVEIVFSGKSKYIAGDFLNATSTGSIAFVVAHKKVYEKVSRMLNYFHRLQEFERLHENGLQNLMLFRDDEFLEFLWELKNPEKVPLLAVDKKYSIVFRDRFIPRMFSIYPHTMRHKPSLSGESLKRLLVYGFDVTAEAEEHDVILMTTRYTSPSSAEVYEISTPTEKHVRVMDLIDLVVRAEYRDKGIGTQMLKIFEKIARENRCQYVCGELGFDRPGEPIELQKQFFEKNGYALWFDKRAQFSGWVVKKAI